MSLECEVNQLGTITIDEAFELQEAEKEVQNEISYLQRQFHWSDLGRTYNMVIARLNKDKATSDKYIAILDSIMNDRLGRHTSRNLHY